MIKDLKPGDVIAKEQYVVKVDGKTINYTLTLERSGAFDYGNGTCMTVHTDWKGSMDQYYDTRYCSFAPTPKAFRDWSLEWLKRTLRPECEIERS